MPVALSWSREEVMMAVCVCVLWFEVGVDCCRDWSGWCFVCFKKFVERVRVRYLGCLVTVVGQKKPLKLMHGV